MGLHNKLPEGLEEVDVIIAGGSYAFAIMQLVGLAFLSRVCVHC